MRTGRFLGVVAAAMAVGMSGVAWGQASPNRVDPRSAPGPTAAGATPVNQGRPTGPSASFSLGGGYTPSADLEDGRGEVSVIRSGADLSLFVPVSEKAALTFTVSNEWSWYDFSPSSTGTTSVNGVLIGKPVSQVTVLRLAPGVAIEINERWSILAGLSLDAAGETDADVQQSLIYGGLFAARYKVSETLSFTFGAAGASALEEEVTFIPIVGVDWRFAPKWSFAVQGPGAKVTYFATETLDVTLQASYESREYRLGDDGPIPEGVFRDRRVSVGLQAQWTPRKDLSVRGEVGVAVWSEYEFNTDTGRGLDTLDADPVPYVGASVTYRF